MATQVIKHYDSPHQFEPLLPEERFLGPLLEKASDLIRAAGALTGAQAAHSDLRVLLRAMNSYYTNKIEGQHTRPVEIERALQDDFSANADIARRQRLAIAHMRTEEVCEKRIDRDLAAGADVVRDLYSALILRWLHQQLFDGLADQDRQLADGTSLTPGEFRTRQVAVGIHEPPLATSLDAFVRRWAEAYGQARRGEMSLVAAAASHQRLAWIHPFLDGNGRVVRLHTHLLLHAMGLTKGLWSPLRGFARTEERYKAMLKAADEHRRGDLDDRGNLTSAGLVGWIEYALDVCIDQVHFMKEQLKLDQMQGRILAALTFDSTTRRTGVRIEALLPLHYLFVTQSELPRADFKVMTGLGDRVATDLLSSLIKHGYVATDSPYGKLRFAVPRHALRFYFPNLWPEAERDEAMLLPAAAPSPSRHRPR